jgi:hypothetical protein
MLPTVGRCSRHLAGLVALVVAFVACSCASAVASDGSFRWSAPKRVDAGTTVAHPVYARGLACPATTLCIGVGAYGGIVTSTQPTSASSWKVFHIGKHEFQQVACASTSLCLAIDRGGSIERSTDPAGGPAAWSSLGKPLGNSAYDSDGDKAVSCPTTSLCVAVNGRASVATTTDPGAPVPTWTVHKLDADLELAAVACPSASACLALDDNDQLLTSTNPLGDASAWHVTDFGKEIDDIACASESACILMGGKIFSSTDAFSARPTWKATELGAGTLSDISCAPGGPCAVSDDFGGVSVASVPTDGKQAWTRTIAERSGVNAVACASASLCVVNSDAGTLAISAAPASATPVWTPIPRLAGGGTRPDEIVDVDCASIRLCVAIDDRSRVLSTAHPTGGPSAWQSRSLGAELGLYEISCAAGFCELTGDGLVASSTHPLGASASWHVTDLALTSEDSTDGNLDRGGLGEISCASRTFCVATHDGEGLVNLDVSLDPSATPPTWRDLEVGNPADDGDGPFFDVACPAPTLCAATGDHGQIATSTDAAQHWSTTLVEGPATQDARIEAISCPSRSFCAGIDDVGQVIVTRAPEAATRSAWHRSRIAGRHRLEHVACASASLCVGIDRKGRAVMSTQPDVPGSSWRAQPGVKAKVMDVDCPSTKLCLLVTNDGRLIAGTRRRHR